MRYQYQWIGMLCVVTLFCGLAGCSAQSSYGTDQLRLSKTIPLPGVKGRIDHLDVNLRDRVVYVAALGNNSLEVVDLGRSMLVGKWANDAASANFPMALDTAHHRVLVGYRHRAWLVGYKQTANILTRIGARTSLWVPGWRMLMVAARAASGQPAGLLIYESPK